MQRQLLLRNILVIVVIVALIIVGLFIWRHHQQTAPLPAPPEPGTFPSEKAPTK